MKLTLPPLKRKIRKIFLKLPHLRAKRERYIKYIRSCYDYSAPTPTIICSSCIGGMISHNLGLKFMSPTVNLWLTSTDLVKLVCEPQKYLSADLRLIRDDWYNYPIGILEDIYIFFQHYTTEQDARDRWNERKKRIDPENLYIITDDKGLSDADITRLMSASCKRLIVFTAGEEKNDCFFRLNCYKNEVGRYSVIDLRGLAPFEREFNYAAWLSGEKDFRMHEGTLYGR